jgi:hypothetical protein
MDTCCPHLQVEVWVWALLLGNGAGARGVLGGLRRLIVLHPCQRRGGLLLRLLLRLLVGIYDLIRVVPRINAAARIRISD